MANTDFTLNGWPANNNAPSVRTLAGATGVWFDYAANGGSGQHLESSGLPAANTIYGGSDWSIEFWAWNEGGERNGENPVFQWGPRSANACHSSGFGVGSHPTWGASAHWACDSPYAVQAGSTETGPAGGQRPTSFKWHHLAFTYANGVQLTYVDGLLNNQFNSILNIDRSVNFFIGSFWDGGLGDAGQVAIGALRLHDGVLSAADVLANYLVDSVAYGIPTPTPTSSATPSPSSTQVVSFTPTPCPTAFTGTTHFLKTVSISLLGGNNQFVRHACNWMFGTPSYPTTDAGSAQDASFVVRAGLDGTPGSFSFESVNFQVRGGAAGRAARRA